MNIFYSDEDPIIAAQNLDSKRVIKMVLESCQLLSNSMYERGLESPYGPTHEHHSCSVAVYYNTRNYDWLLEHFKALCHEYKFRYGKEHKCSQYVDLFMKNPPVGILEGEKLSFPNCTKFKEEPDLILAYRMTLLDKWAQDKRKPKWSGTHGSRTPPHWAINSPWFTLYSEYEVTADD